MPLDAVSINSMRLAGEKEAVNYKKYGRRSNAVHTLLDRIQTAQDTISEVIKEFVTTADLETADLIREIWKS